jgi:HNH endonuclease
MRTTTTCPVCGTVFTRIHAEDKPPRYCSRACSNKAPGRMTAEVRAKIGRPSPQNKGGWIQRDRFGGERWRVPIPHSERHLHPTIDKHGYIARSHLVWNQTHPDEPVLPGELIHHMNHDSLDDRPENLMKLSSQSLHAQHHAPSIAARRQRNSEGRFISPR